MSVIFDVLKSKKIKITTNFHKNHNDVWQETALSNNLIFMVELESAGVGNISFFSTVETETKFGDDKK